MICINFKSWLKEEIIKETATGTNCIAGFARITMPLVRRIWPQEVEDNFFKKKKKNKID